jgi:hypothetical protein
MPQKLFCTKSRTSVLKARTFYSGMHVQSSLTFESEAGDDPGEAVSQKGCLPYPQTGNSKGGSITVPLTSCLTSFGISCMTTEIFCFLCAKQTNLNQSNRRSMVQ